MTTQAPCWIQPTDAPDIMTNAGMDYAMQQMRLGVLWDVLDIARGIWSWNAPQYAPTLRESAEIYADGFRCREHRRQDTLDYIAQYVPGGLDANIFELDRDVRRELMSECITQTKAKMNAIRSGLS